MSQTWGRILTVTGLIGCPCHLPLTLPLLVGILGGTSIGGVVADNQGLIYGIATGYFVVGVGLGLYLLYRRKAIQGAACELPEKQGALRNRKARRPT